ncbi:hypothetical protein DT076_07705 [Desertihabitans brevis]|uniref:Transglycosylase SLT domain-containing protein n=2 Tax=Desertihabitans brevis TaxID=2268447 RepID=A0A367YW31_9ACTN|nr:hypothetical protein DT076_07705 [Desertihabitans brevis]
MVSVPLVSAVPLTHPLSAVPAPRPPVVEPEAGPVERPQRTVEREDRAGGTLPDQSAVGTPTPSPGPSPGGGPSDPVTLDPDVPASPERDPATLPDPSSEVTDLDLPAAALRAYRGAADALARTDPSCRLDWALLAGIGRVESDHGRHGGSVVGVDGSTSPRIIGVPLDGSGGVAAIRDTDGGRLDGDPVWDRAVGPMQFIPSTWAGVAADGDGDGVRDPHDLDDAALAAARYLCAGSGDLGTRTGAEAAVLRYNHSAEYVTLVLGIAEAYRDGRVALPTVPPHPDPSEPSRPGPSGTPDPSEPPGPSPSGSPSPSSSSSPTPPSPSPSPSATPSASPSPSPSGSPSPSPSGSPSPSPSGSPSPSPSPSGSPSPSPSGSPSPSPSGSPSPSPSGTASPSPSDGPSPSPSR